MRHVFSEGVPDSFLKPYGMSERTVADILARPEQRQVIVLEGAGNPSVGMYASRAEGDADGAVSLVIGMVSAEQLHVVMVLKVPPRIAAPQGALEPPLAMLEGLVNECGLPMRVGEHVAKFIINQRIHATAGTPVHGPIILNPNRAPLMTIQLVRPHMGATESYADCGLCFAIDVDAYKHALGLAGAPRRLDFPPPPTTLSADDPAVQNLSCFGVPAPLAVRALRENDGLLLVPDDRPEIAHAIRWFEDGQIIFASAWITKSWPAEQGRTFIDGVRLALALSLRPELPGGMLDREAGIARNLEIIARSFGRKVLCHPEFGYHWVYSGPWDGQDVRLLDAPPDEMRMGSGAFDHHSMSCDCVWSFSMNLYQKWRQSLATG